MPQTSRMLGLGTCRDRPHSLRCASLPPFLRASIGNDDSGLVSLLDFETKTPVMHSKLPLSVCEATTWQWLPLCKPHGIEQRSKCTVHKGDNKNTCCCCSSARHWLPHPYPGEWYLGYDCGCLAGYNYKEKKIYFFKELVLMTFLNLKITVNYRRHLRGKNEKIRVC